MTRRVTALLALLFLLIAGTATAQTEVTVREINAIGQAALDQLNAGGTALTLNEVDTLIQSAFANEEVTFTAVLMTDPFLSGLRSVDNPGTPDEKVPVVGFVRDVTADTEGPDGMGIQIFTEEPATVGLSDVTFGDVIRMTGMVSYFSTGQIQVEVTALELQGDYQSLGFSDDLVAPAMSSTAEINVEIDVAGTPEVQANWDRFAALNGQFVRLENVTVLDRTLTETSNPQMLISSDNGTTYMQLDTRYSVRYNNSRIGSYPDEFFTREQGDAWEPPAIGSTINIQGFLLYESTSFEAFTLGAEPDGAWLALIPYTDDDIEVTASPPNADRASKPDAVPTSSDAVTVTSDVSVDPTRAIDSVTLTYFTSADPTEMAVPMVSTGKTSGTTEVFEAEIPAQPDGAFVIYEVTAADNTGAARTSPKQDYRVMNDGIDAIADIQEPSGFTGDEGDHGPFNGITTAMNLTVTIQNNPAVNGREYAAQDDPDLNPWTGIYINPTDELTADLQPGDVINITEARIVEDFDVTQLRDLVYTTVTERGDRIPFKEVTTDVLQDVDVSEAHEGMALTFDDVVITSTNADAPSGPFGEFTISTDGTADNAVRVDDRSNGIEYPDTDGDGESDENPGDVFAEGERLDFVRGIWYFSFGDYKLMPDDLANDVGAVINVANEDADVPDDFALRQNYPNPFNPATSIEYAVPSAGHVRLEVFDMLGRSVGLLVDGDLTPGVYTARFDARSLASGVYLYRLTAGERSSTRTMLLLK